MMRHFPWYRGFIRITSGEGVSRYATARHWLPLASERYTARPELAGVGIATDVLDAVKWGA